MWHTSNILLILYRFHMDYLGQKENAVVTDCQGLTAYQDNPAAQEREALRVTREIGENEDTLAELVCAVHVIFYSIKLSFSCLLLYLLISLLTYPLESILYRK